MILLKLINFEFVSSDLMKLFFENIRIESIDFDLFESLKRRLFTDYSNLDRLVTRWKLKPKHISPTETIQLFQILNSYFKEEKNPIEQTKILIEQIKHLQNENQSLQTKILQMEEKNIEMKGKTISYRNNPHGILQIFDQADSSQFSLSFSSIGSNYQPENILKYDDSLFSNSRSTKFMCLH
jgi:hypothetical protein